MILHKFGSLKSSKHAHIAVRAYAFRLFLRGKIEIYAYVFRSLNNLPLALCLRIIFNHDVRKFFNKKFKNRVVFIWPAVSLLFT